MKLHFIAFPLVTFGFIIALAVTTITTEIFKLDPIGRMCVFIPLIIVLPTIGYFIEHRVSK